MEHDNPDGPMIDYDLTKIRALVFDVDGVLAATTIPMDAEGNPSRTLNVRDGYALQLAVKKGLTVALITGAKTEQVRLRYEGLGIRHIYMASAVKTRDLDDLLARTGIAADEVLYMGDDIPDYEVMQRVGLPTCPADAAPEVKAVARYVSPVAGGYGAVRDVVEQVMKAQGLWMSSADAFGW